MLSSAPADLDPAAEKAVISLLRTSLIAHTNGATDGSRLKAAGAYLELLDGREKELARPRRGRPAKRPPATGCRPFYSNSNAV